MLSIHIDQWFENFGLRANFFCFFNWAGHNPIIVVTTLILNLRTSNFRCSFAAFHIRSYLFLTLVQYVAETYQYFMIILHHRSFYISFRGLLHPVFVYGVLLLFSCCVWFRAKPAVCYKQWRRNFSVSGGGGGGRSFCEKVGFQTNFELSLWLFLSNGFMNSADCLQLLFPRRTPDLRGGGGTV